MRAEQTIDDNLTVNQSLSILQDTNLFGPATFGRLLENPAMEGFRISLEQSSWASTVTNVVTPGYQSFRDVIVEDFGEIEGYWAPAYDWVTITDSYPATYDEDLNLLTEAWTDTHDEYQQVGMQWISVPTWGVTGTHIETEEFWVPEETETVEVTNYDAPRALFTATRSDTNWVFRAPGTTNGQMRDALTIYNGGLLMNSENGQATYSVNPSQSLQSLRQPASSTQPETYYNAKRSAGLTEHRSQSWWQLGGVNRSAIAESTSRPEFIRLSRTEFAGAETNSAQTQIAAKSAQFGGMVTVEGDLKVKGALRVLPAGDLRMDYHAGPTPNGN